METILKFFENFILRAYADTNTMIELPTNSQWATFDALLNDILKYMVWISIAACFIFFSIGALQFIFNNGELQQIGKARNAMIWSAIGMVVIIIGYVMLKWVGSLFGYTSIF